MTDKNELFKKEEKDNGAQSVTIIADDVPKEEKADELKAEELNITNGGTDSDVIIKDPVPPMPIEKIYIDPNLCTKCEICYDTCPSNAIAKYKIDPNTCTSCHLCAVVCPANAIKIEIIHIV